MVKKCIRESESPCTGLMLVSDLIWEKCGLTALSEANAPFLNSIRLVPFVVAPSGKITK